MTSLDKVQSSVRCSGNHARSVRRIRREHAMVANQWKSWRRNESACARQKFERRHEPMGGSAAARCLDSVSDATIRKPGQPLEREAGAQRIAAESFAPLGIGGRNADASVKVETVVLGSEALLAAVPTSRVVIALRKREGQSMREKGMVELTSRQLPRGGDGERTFPARG